MSDFILILPEICLLLTLIFVIVAEITYHGEQVRWVKATALVGLGAALVQTVVAYQYGPIQVFHQAFAVDGLSLFFKLFFITLAALALIASAHTREIPRSRQAEYCALVIASTLGMCVASSASDLLLAFLSLQFVNILAFFIAGYGKRSLHSIEAAVKYMITSAVGGALLLYGLALLFSVTHTMNVYEIHRALVAAPLSAEHTLAILMLVLLSFSFQLGAFPMYFWMPDVIEGAPTPASGFLSLSVRAVGLAVALRFLIAIFAQPGSAEGQWQVLGSVDWTNIVALISAASMLIGSLLALRQEGAKRLIGNLLIAQTGFLLLGLLVLDQIGVAAVFYNLVIELFSLIGIFYVLAYLLEEFKTDRLTGLRGMMGKAVPESICLVLFLLTLIGIPPMPGFIGKFTLIGAAVRHDRLSLAVVAILSMTLSTVGVARLAYSLAGDLRMTVAFPAASSVKRQLFLAALIGPIVLFGVFAEHILNWAGKSVSFILW
ncbi:MAG: NADH-quinone oxidoreductase subunit N [Oligoflexia bacterium]|nr:NADH-quinone oxidoreductase subunit N [Oligoflexia bacterium]